MRQPKFKSGETIKSFLKRVRIWEQLAGRTYNLGIDRSSPEAIILLSAKKKGFYKTGADGNLITEDLVGPNIANSVKKDIGGPTWITPIGFPKVKPFSKDYTKDRSWIVETLGADSVDEFDRILSARRSKLPKAMKQDIAKEEFLATAGTTDFSKVQLPDQKLSPLSIEKQQVSNKKKLYPYLDDHEFIEPANTSDPFNRIPSRDRTPTELSALNEQKKMAQIQAYSPQSEVKRDYDGSKIEQDPYKVLQGLSISQGATTNTTNTGTGYTEADKLAWLDKTRNSPAALAGIPDDQRWNLQVAHRKWVEDRQKGNKNRRSLMDILNNRRPGVVGKKTNPNNIIPTVQQVEDGY
tara:strand:+ start:774 stop:1829 length:1056 start_codon:yes stop_codon:yes gene_type:complete